MKSYHKERVKIIGKQSAIPAEKPVEPSIFLGLPRGTLRKINSNFAVSY